MIAALLLVRRAAEAAPVLPVMPSVAMSSAATPGRRIAWGLALIIGLGHAGLGFWLAIAAGVQAAWTPGWWMAGVVSLLSTLPAIMSERNAASSGGRWLVGAAYVGVFSTGRAMYLSPVQLAVGLLVWWLPQLLLAGFFLRRPSNGPTTAIREFKASAVAGDQRALESLGYAYEEFARATAKKCGDYRSIVEAGIRRSSAFRQEGKAEAEYALGNLYEFQSKELEAAKWLRRAADREHAMAQWQLGSKYLIGRIGSEGLDQDLYQARMASLLEWKPTVEFTQTGKASRRTTPLPSSGSSER